MRSARTRMRVPILVVLPVLAAQLSPLKIQTAAHAPPPDFWWDDKPPAVECPPPIHPDEWLIVPKGAAFGPTQVFLRYLLDPSGDPPSIGTERTGEDLWQSVRARSGRIINCVSPNGTARCSKNAGGWPTLAMNRRTLTLPANPNQVDGSGYTNLEKWLHRMAAEVEGVPPPKYPGAPSEFRAR